VKCLIVLISPTDKETFINIELAFEMCLQECSLIGVDTEEKCLKTIIHSPPDLIILDCDLLQENGLALLKETHRLSDKPVICLSSVRDENYIVKILENGADQFHAKPVRQLEFIARIKVLLRRAVTNN
jgi:DNA-binding response OmpR family regulator